MPKKDKKRSKIINFSNALIVIGVFLLIFGGLLLALFLHKEKRYDPALESKLDMKTIPREVKKELKTASVSASFRVPVLLYHYVEYVQDKKDTIRQSLNINPYIFEQQIITLKKSNYTFMTASDLGKVLDGKMEMPENPILLTFDDGHRDFYTDAYPILKKYNVRATAYIVADFLGGSDFMDTYQLQKIANDGLVEIGDHTLHHAYLKKQTEKFYEKEIVDSKIQLQNVLHIPIVSFAYPYGAFDKKAIDVVRNAGFTTAMSTLPGIIVSQTNRYLIERIRPGGRIGENLINFLKTYQQPLQTAIHP